MEFRQKIQSLIQEVKNPSFPSYERVKKEQLGFTVILLTPIGYGIGALYYFKYQAPMATAIMITHMTALVVLGLLRKKKIHNTIYQNLVIFLYISLFTCLTSVTGGISSQDLFWIPIAPTVAGAFIRRRDVVFWSIFCTFIVGFFFTDLSQGIVTNEILPQDSSHLFFISAFSMILVLTTVSLISESLRIKINREKENAIATASRSANLASLGEMAGGIAHEINNPLMIISGSSLVAEKALEKIPPDISKAKKHIQTIKRTTQRASNIIKGLKTLSRDGQLDNREVVCLKDVFDDILGFLSNRFHAKEVELIFDMNAPLLHIPLGLFRVQFSQVLLNLITNSFDAIEDLEERWIKIEVTQDTDKNLDLHITDSGPGIPKDIRARMFTPFFTTKPVGKGTGLGLPLCFSIIEKTGGLLTYNERSENTSFKIHLPRNLRTSLEAQPPKKTNAA